MQEQDQNSGLGWKYVEFVQYVGFCIWVTIWSLQRVGGEEERRRKIIMRASGDGWAENVILTLGGVPFMRGLFLMR